MVRGRDSREQKKREGGQVLPPGTHEKIRR
jgi:hypothetical protein